MASKAAITVVLGSPQEKKTVVRYDATDDGAAITNAYVDKAALATLNGGDGFPAQITLTIS